MKDWLDEVPWNQHGLVAVVTQEASSGRVLTVAWMNRDALDRTVQGREAVYFSRSRNRLWRKGEESGHAQRVIELRIDCDQDAVWLKVAQAGAGACHTGRRSCFYRAIPLGQSGAVTLEFRESGRVFDPSATYRGRS